MKKFIPLILVGLATLILTGCYTKVAMSDDGYTYSEPAPIIIIEPAPPPVVIIHPIIGGPHPKPPREKIRKPVIERPKNERKRDPLRNTGGRNDSGKRGR